MRVGRRVILDDEDAFVLVLTPKSGDEVELYISARTWLVVRRDAAGESTRYADFRNVDGEVVPFFISTQGALGERNLKVSKVTFNVAIPSATFGPLDWSHGPVHGTGEGKPRATGARVGPPQKTTVYIC